VAPGAAGGAELEALAEIARVAVAGDAVIDTGVVPADAAEIPAVGGDPASAGEAGEAGVTLG
jgi:hypothetical protein